MFEKITPEAAGISSAALAKFINILNRRGMQMHSVLMMKGDKLFAEYYWAPFNKDFCHRMYSQTKSYTSVAIGLLEEEGKLSLDDPIAKYFPEKIYNTLPAHLANQTIREMLTMTTVGDAHRWFDFPEYPDRTVFYFNHRRLEGGRAAGTTWDYDSAGSMVLANLVDKLAGMPLFDYLNEKIFKHLGTFKTAEILKTRNGDSWGDSALVCTPRDMISFARFVMNYGTWDGKRLMNEEYLRAATAKQVDNTEYEESIWRYGYGYQIWRTDMGGFAFYGMGSQLTICLPEQDIIFVCTADTQGNMSAAQCILGNLFDLVMDSYSENPLPENKEGEAALKEATSNLTLISVKGGEDSPLRKELEGRVYKCQNNNCGISEFSFSFSEDGKEGVLRYVNEQGEKRLPFGINHNVFCKFPQLGYSDGYGGLRTTNGFMYNAAVSGAWVQENKIRLNVQIIDRYFGNANWLFSFKGEDATLTMIKRAEDFMDEYVGQVVAKAK